MPPPGIHNRINLGMPVECIDRIYSFRTPQGVMPYDAGSVFLLKEVIQPLLPERLPCYDFVLITSHTFGGFILAVRSPTSGITSFHDVTGGVYKTRERIHGSMLTCHY